METERLSFIPLQLEYATMLLSDPQQLEEALCVAYDGPELEGHWTSVLRQLVSQRDTSTARVSHEISPKVVVWLILMQAEETIIGILETIRSTNSSAWQFRYAISSAYQHLGYEAEIETMMAQSPSLESR